MGWWWGGGTHTRGFNLGIFAFSLGTSSSNTPPAAATVATSTVGYAKSVSSISGSGAKSDIIIIGERCMRANNKNQSPPEKERIEKNTTYVG